MRLRDWVIALSLANLFFLSGWAALQDRTQLYYRRMPPDVTEVAACAANVLLLASLLAAAIWLVRRIHRPWVSTLARCAFLVLLIVPFRNMSVQFPALSFPFQWTRDVAGRTGLMVAALVAIAIVLIWNRRASGIAASLLLILSPLFVVNAAGSLLMVRSLRGAGFADPQAPPAGAPPRSAQRVLVLLFDELDYRLAFAQRPAWLRLPELDRLRAGSTFALDAYPAQWETMLSVPSMLTGRQVQAAQHDTGDQLVLASDGANLPWNRIPNIFSEARQAGHRTALVGWFHPYCRVLGASLDSCFCETGVSDRPEWNRPLSLAANMRLQIRRQLTAVPLLHLYRDSGDVARPEHRREYLELHERAQAVAADPSFGLVFLHYPVPHPPGMFDPAKNDFDLEHYRGYVDNLPLVDRTLRELRARMERAGTWDSTTVILTADHPLRMHYWSREADKWGRTSSPRVPLMIKLAGENRGVEFALRINNRLLHDLTSALLGGEIRIETDLLRWLGVHLGGPAPQPPEMVTSLR